MADGNGTGTAVSRVGTGHRYRYREYRTRIHGYGLYPLSKPLISLYLLSIEIIPLNPNQRFHFHCLYFTSPLLKASSTHKTLADSLPFPFQEVTHPTTTIIASLPSSRFPSTLPLLKHQFSLQFVFPFRPAKVPLYHFILNFHGVDCAVVAAGPRAGYRGYDTWIRSGDPPPLHTPSTEIRD
jgi:hypothetical protein